MSGDFQFAADTRGCMHELDFAAELVGYEIANHAGAVSRASRWHHGRAAALLPPDRKPALGVSVSSLAPAHRDMAALGRKRAEFCGIVASSWKTIAIAWPASALKISSAPPICRLLPVA